MSASVPGSPVIETSHQATVGRLSAGTALRRVTGWIQGWHGGQLLTFWAGAAVVPWQIGAWRRILFRHRFEAFLDPGRHLGRTGRVAEIVVYVVLPLLAVLVTAVWVSGRVRPRPSPRG